MCSRWCYFLYPNPGDRLRPDSGLAEISRGIRLDTGGASVLPAEFGSTDVTPCYIRVAGLDAVRYRLSSGEHLGVSLRFGLTRVQFFSFHRASEPQIGFTFSTHESDEDQRSIHGRILTFGTAARAAYVVVTSEWTDLREVFRFPGPVLTLESVSWRSFGHGIHAVYVRSNLGGRVPEGLDEAAGTPTEWDYRRYAVPGTINPEG